MTAMRTPPSFRLSRWWSWPSERPFQQIRNRRVLRPDVLGVSFPQVPQRRPAVEPVRLVLAQQRHDLPDHAVAILVAVVPMRHGVHALRGFDLGNDVALAPIDEVAAVVAVHVRDRAMS